MGAGYGAGLLPWRDGSSRSVPRFLRERGAQGIQPFTVGLWVAVVRIRAHPCMGVTNASCMFDRAPELFGTGCDFPRIGDDAVGITAEHAIEFFDNIQVGEVLAVNDNKV